MPALLAAGLLVVVLTGAVRSDEPVTAVGVFVCSKAQGVIVNYRDGTQKFLKPGDPDIAEVIKKLPVEKRNSLTMSGPYCFSPPPQVN